MNISTQIFKETVFQNLQSYSLCSEFWLPNIEARAGFHELSAGDLLLNPLFRWIYLKRTDKIEAFEKQLSLLQSALGIPQFQVFHKQLFQDLSRHPIENYAHNRLLSALTEMEAILRFSDKGFTISLIPRNGGKTPDFKADKDSQAQLVEVKYIRPPDKLEEYLFRWWQAQKELEQPRLQELLLPHLKFDWDPVASRDELSKCEIIALKEYFTSIYQQPTQPCKLTTGRLVIRFDPDRRLPVTTEPLSMKASRSEETAVALFAKIKNIVENALMQLDSDKSQLRTIVLAINLSTDIQFLWHERYSERIEALRLEHLDKGVIIIVEEVGYL